MRLGLLLLLVVVGSSGCSPFLPAPEAGSDGGAVRRIPDVPYHPQAARSDCGPAALAALLGHRGMTIAVAEIDRQVYSPELGGSLLPDMENYARRQGFATRSGRGDLELLRRQIDRGRPLLIPVDAGSWSVSRPHYLVVFGYTPQRFLVHAGTRQGVYLEAQDLWRRWQKMNRLYLFLE